MGELVKIECRCINCKHSEPRYRHAVGVDDLLYCYYWDYEIGMSPNCVDVDDFCSNGERA